MSATQIETIPAEVMKISLQNGSFATYTSNISKEAETIPVIDVARMYSENLEDRKACAEEIRQACHDIGFFYVINHRMDPALATKAFEHAKSFFALPLEKKMDVLIGTVPDETVGYLPMEGYMCGCSDRDFKDLQETFNFAYSADEDPDAENKSVPSTSIWPDVPGFREGMYAYHTPMMQFARRLTKLFALALHMPENAFDEYVKNPEAEMRLAHYPHQERTLAQQNGVGAHTDFECFTIVTQEETAGLEILSKSGSWIKANPIPNAFVVNIADCFMRQTNDYFVSTVHRVINQTGKERYSLPFFFGFDRTMKLKPVETCISAENPSKYPAMTSGEYYAWRSAQA